ncbi:hypothetical protein RD792_017024 [Penstemon davidsonii]|uniref:Uncharacterized protein n=1 Tax=Penstemon davidsonii TaxID=160366 RepID=A0ABR0CKW3_9LAMI|nr:hypothetical protein RD792_017024 [Penstemon davidsonii]
MANSSSSSRKETALRLRAAAEEVVQCIGLGYDLTLDLRLKYCKKQQITKEDSRLIAMDVDHVRDIAVPGVFWSKTYQNRSTVIKASECGSALTFQFAFATEQCHRKIDCPKNLTCPNGKKDESQPNDSELGPSWLVEKIQKPDYGEWLQLQRQRGRTRPQGKPLKEKSTGGSQNRFSGLVHFDEKETDNPNKEDNKQQEEREKGLQFQSQNTKLVKGKKSTDGGARKSSILKESGGPLILTKSKSEIVGENQTVGNIGPSNGPANESEENKNPNLSKNIGPVGGEVGSLTSASVGFKNTKEAQLGKGPVNERVQSKANLPTILQSSDNLKKGNNGSDQQEIHPHMAELQTGGDSTPPPLVPARPPHSISPGNLTHNYEASTTLNNTGGNPDNRCIRNMEIELLADVDMIEDDMGTGSPNWSTDKSNFDDKVSNIFALIAIKPPIEELHQFLEFQLPRQWAPVFGDVPYGPDRKQQGSASLQFSLMGPKLYVNTNEV